MNLKEGGDGGFTSVEHQQKCSIAGKEAFNLKMKNDAVFREKFKNILLVNNKKAHENGNCKYDNFKDKKHTDESKAKLSNSRKINNIGIGNSNSQFGSCWITNGIENKKIKKGDLIPEGWKLGRKLK
jgi:hypothetical protein